MKLSYKYYPNGLSVPASNIRKYDFKQKVNIESIAVLPYTGQAKEIGGFKMAYRQFLLKESGDTVLCEWDARRGQWRCSSAPGSPYNLRVDTLSETVRSMKADGFEELTPNLRKTIRFSKSEHTYIPISESDHQAPPLEMPVSKKKH